MLRPRRGARVRSTVISRAWPWPARLIDEAVVPVDRGGPAGLAARD